VTILHKASPENSWCINAIRSHFSLLFIEYRTSGQQLICHVETHIGDRQLVHLHVELTMRGECWVRFCVLMEYITLCLDSTNKVEQGTYYCSTL